MYDIIIIFPDAWRSSHTCALSRHLKNHMQENQDCCVSKPQKSLDVHQDPLRLLLSGGCMVSGYETKPQVIMFSWPLLVMKAWIYKDYVSTNLVFSGGHSEQSVVH